MIIRLRFADHADHAADSECQSRWTAAVIRATKAPAGPGLGLTRHHGPGPGSRVTAQPEPRRVTVRPGRNHDRHGPGTHRDWQTVRASPSPSHSVAA